MKIHVVKPDQEAIENFKKVVCLDNNIDVSEVSDNECELIMANDVIDSFDIPNIEGLLGLLISKLRINGTMVIGGTDLRLLCKSVINDQLSELDASQIISGLKSATSLESLRVAIQSMGLNFVSSQISGVHYELTLKRG
tara:strand:- start:30 stop:446 length:417 start_codon:yes stop_codon:yes gene_type:complete